MDSGKFTFLLIALVLMLVQGKIYILLSNQLQGQTQNNIHCLLELNSNNQKSCLTSAAYQIRRKDKTVRVILAFRLPKIYFLNEIIGAPANEEMKDEQTVSSILEDVSGEVQSNDMIEDEDDIADTEEDESSDVEEDSEGLLIRNNS